MDSRRWFLSSAGLINDAERSWVQRSTIVSRSRRLPRQTLGVRNVRLATWPRSIVMRTEDDGMPLQVDYCDVPRILAEESLLGGPTHHDGPAAISPSSCRRCMRTLRAQSALVDVAAQGTSTLTSRRTVGISAGALCCACGKGGPQEGCRTPRSLHHRPLMHAQINAPIDPRALALRERNTPLWTLRLPRVVGFLMVAQ